MVTPTELEPQEPPTYEQLRELSSSLLEKHGEPTTVPYAAPEGKPVNRYGMRAVLYGLIRKELPTDKVVSGNMPARRVSLPFAHHDNSLREGAELLLTEGVTGHFEPKLTYTHSATTSDPHGGASSVSQLGSEVYCRIELPMSPMGYDGNRYKSFYGYLRELSDYLDSNPRANFPFTEFATERRDWLEEQEGQINAEQARQ